MTSFALSLVIGFICLTLFMFIALTFRATVYSFSNWCFFLILLLCSVVSVFVVLQDNKDWTEHVSIQTKILLTGSFTVCVRRDESFTRLRGFYPLKANLLINVWFNCKLKKSKLCLMMNYFKYMKIEALYKLPVLLQHVQTDRNILWQLFCFLCFKELSAVCDFLWSF